MQIIVKVKKLPRYIFITLLSCLLFILCFLIAALIEPNTFQKFFSAISLQAVENNKNIIDKAGYYYDVTAYASMAIVDQCQAFYPMFSWIIRYLFHPKIFEQAVIGLKITSFICFILGIPLFFTLVTSISKNKKNSYLLTLIYTISPMAIFRVIGYTEGFFALLTLVLIWLISNISLNKKVVYISTFFIVFIMSLTRPISLQLVFSATIALIMIALVEKLRSKLGWRHILAINKDKYQHLIFLSLLIILGTIVGYSIYGSLCLQLRGDFLAPFNDQKLWGKALGFYPQIFLSLEYPLFEQMSLYFPIIFLVGIVVSLYSFVKSIQIEIFIPSFSLFWGLVSLYPSILIVIYILVFLTKRRNINNLTSINLYASHKAKELFSNYTFWFCFNFVLSHIIINLFTVGKIYSLARFTFSLPFFFMFLAYLLQDVRNRGVERILKWFIFIETVALIEQWVRYGKNLWLG